MTGFSFWRCVEVAILCRFDGDNATFNKSSNGVPL